jgi:hypothetical protein
MGGEHERGEMAQIVSQGELISYRPPVARIEPAGRGACRLAAAGASSAPAVQAATDVTARPPASAPDRARNLRLDMSLMSLTSALSIMPVTLRRRLDARDSADDAAAQDDPLRAEQHLRLGHGVGGVDRQIRDGTVRQRAGSPE